MKTLILAGGFAAFCLTFVIRIFAESPVSVALRDGMVACLAVAVVLKWFWGYILRHYEAALAENTEAEEAGSRKEGARNVSPTKD